jgi:hypothetical protein
MEKAKRTIDISIHIKGNGRYMKFVKICGGLSALLGMKRGFDQGIECAMNHKLSPFEDKVVYTSFSIVSKGVLYGGCGYLAALFSPITIPVAGFYMMTHKSDNDTEQMSKDN